MRKLLLATSAAAVALTLSGHAFAEVDHVAPDAAAVGSTDPSTGDPLTAKEPGQVQPAEQGNPPATVAPAQAQPETTGPAQAQGHAQDHASPTAVPSAAAAQPQAAPQAPAVAGQPGQPQSTQAQPAHAQPVKAQPAQAEPSQAQPGQTQPDQAAQSAPPPAMSAADQAVADQLKELVEHKLRQYVPREQDRAGVLAFYKGRDFKPIWIADGKPAPRERQAAEFLHGVSADGLDPADYPTPRFDNDLADPAKLAADELALTNSVVVFSRHASIGRVAFSRVSGAVYYDRKAPDPAEVLGKLAGEGDTRALLDAYNPQSRPYKALKAELAKVRAGTDEPEQRAVRHSSRNAKRGRRTEDNEPREARSKQAKIDTIIANMERWRWMPHDLGAAYVMVNIPNYTLKVVKDGKTLWQTKIVVGKAGVHATPLLTQTMKYITVNPTWNVPPSIIRNEYLPALAQDPNALARIGLRLTHNPDGSIRIYQPPGAKNALGRIRFNFPNRFLVYQHDTPDKYLFDKSTRAYSHGCMRVQNPAEYAEVLLRVSQPEDHYTAERVKAMYGTTERTITFKHPIPVYLTYQTAFTDSAGKAEERPDIYGLDKEITNVLHGDRRVADVPVSRNYSSSSKPVMASVPRRQRGYSSFGSEDDDYYEPNWRRSDPGWRRSEPGWGRIEPDWRSAYQPRDRFGVW